MRIATSPYTITLLAALAIGAPRAAADEGQWTPDQLQELAEELAAKGLSIPVSALWTPGAANHEGDLLRAVANYGGCSAGFVSPEGLFATNHHCAYGAIQSKSTEEHDYLTDGFVARTRGDELDVKGRTIKVLESIQDVTEAIRGPAGAAATDRQRQEVIERTRKELIAACEAESQTPVRCELAGFYGGNRYQLFRFVELLDVRLVYAPPAAIGEYGGEVDNWMWPRHTGDFSLLRAYVGKDGKPAPYAADNVPYRPTRYFQVSTDGVAPGDFVAILGYPGHTNRYLAAAEIARQMEQVLPFKVDFYGEWIAILEAQGERDEGVRIKVAALLKRLANRHKNARGMLEGLDHMKLLDKRRADEAGLRAAAADDPAGLRVLDEMDALVKTSHADFTRSALLDQMGLGPNLLAVGIDLVRKSRAAAMPDIERPEAYQERQWDRLWRGIEGHVRDFDAAVDAELLASLLARDAALPKAQRIPALAQLARRAPEARTRADFLPLARQLVDGSKLSDKGFVESLWNGSDGAGLAKSDDPMVALARGIADAMETSEAGEKTLRGAMARLQPSYFDMLREARQGPIYPDANGTLRVSYATVQGYDKWDGQTQTPQTVLAGAVRKHTGEEPFDLPAKVRQEAKDAGRSRWADADLGDVPLCFLSNGDTTGGNSGSPVIDGRGRLVGLNFDRVWENIAGDFSYYQGHSRNVNVDVRYLLWMLDEVDGADRLLAEMGLANEGADTDQAGAGAPGAKDGAKDDAKGGTSKSSKSGCGCTASGSELGGQAALWLLLVLALGHRVRRWTHA